MKSIIQKQPTHSTIFDLYLPFINTGIRQGILFFICVFILFWVLATETEEYVGPNMTNSFELRSPEFPRTPSATRPEFFAKTDLEKDGYIVLPNADITRVLSHLPKGYVFLQYKYTIRGCSLSTFHRDVTSSPYLYNTSHPVYTFILYRNSGPLLSVCPGSHRTTPFLYSSPITIHGKEKDMPVGVLFHCDLVHAGSVYAGSINNNGNTRYVEQYKIAHVDDVSKLTHLQHINTQRTGNCNISYWYEIVTRKCSWIFSHIFNHHFTPYLQNRPDTHMGKMLLSLYGRDFYNA